MNIMNTRTKYAGRAALLFAVMSGAAQSSPLEPVWSFANVSVNHLDWSQGTERRNHGGKEDFMFLELEGGVGYDWGEFYGFYDLENPGNKRENEDGNEERVAAKIVSHIYLDDNFSFYSHIYHFNSKFFYETNTVLGLGYRFRGEPGFWIKPWLGMHYVDSDVGFTGPNGVIAGWAAGYDFQAFGQNLTATNWHEFESLRHNDYEAANGKFGINGALALWWNIHSRVTAGVQYRYAYDKLGFAGNNNATITTLKYNF